MNIPGFTAEASLHRTQEDYCTSGADYESIALSVLPQKPKGTNPANGKCKARCDGTYDGALLGCGLDPHPDICRSIASNTHSRCLTRCDISYPIAFTMGDTRSAINRVFVL